MTGESEALTPQVNCEDCGNKWKGRAVGLCPECGSSNLSSTFLDKFGKSDGRWESNTPWVGDKDV